MAAALFVFMCTIVPITFALPTGGSIYGKVAFNTGNQSVPNGTVVSLVNGYNVSEYITGFNNTTPAQDGAYQFINVPMGFYKVYAWSPYCVEGYSAEINVTTNDTYTSSVVLMAMPYYANVTADRQSVAYNSQATITVHANDYWGRSVGAGWQILFRTTVGNVTPDNAYTDNDGKVSTTIAWVDNSTPANVTIYAVSANNSSYPLQEIIETPDVTATPTAATPTAPTNATATPTTVPTAAPNATVTVAPTATPPAATPSTVPTPGFELIAALAAAGLALAIRRNK